MAFEQKTFFIENKKNVKSDQFESTSRIEVQPEKPVKRVVLVNATAKIINKEKVGEIVNFSGKTTYQITYQSEDNSFCSAHTFVEWSGKLDQIKEENVTLKVDVVANTVTSFSETEIALSSLVNVEAFAVCKEEIQTVENLTDEFVKIEKTYDFDKIQCSVSDNFNEVVEEEIPEVVSDILCSNAKICVSNVVCGIDSVTVEGTAFASVLYSVDGRIVEMKKDIDFKREVGALGVVPNHLASVNVFLNSLMVTASTNETDKKTNLVFSVELSLDMTVFSKESVSLIQDAFSIEREVENTYECVSTSVFESVQISREDVSVSVQTPENVVEVYPWKANLEITDKTQVENGVLLSGAVAVETLYVMEDGALALDRVFAPCSVLVQDSFLENEFTVCEKILSCKNKNGSEFEIDLSLFVRSEQKRNEYIGFVKNIEEKDEKEKSNAGILVYVTKEGEDIFSVAKAISVKPETILAQNPDMKDVLEEGTRLVIYRQLDVNF